MIIPVKCFTCGTVIGNKYRWYLSEVRKLKSKDKEEIVGYFEIIFRGDVKETEIAYFGILEEYFGKKLGGYLLSEAIKISFNLSCARVWVHTCSLDHRNALLNYQSRGMKIFKSETLIR